MSQREPRGRRLPVVSADALAQLTRLHQAVDGLAAPLLTQHASRLQCRRGCAGCCSDGLTVFALEAARIAAHYAALLERDEPHPPGACAFLDDEGACRVYAHRPYVCRTQGLPLRWLEVHGEEVVELRDICELNSDPDARDEVGSTRAPLSLTALPAEQCFTLGPVETRLREQAQAAGADARVELRALFRRTEAKP